MPLTKVTSSLINTVSASQIDASGATAGQSLVYNGSSWAAASPSVNKSSFVDLLSFLAQPSATHTSYPVPVFGYMNWSITNLYNTPGTYSWTCPAGITQVGIWIAGAGGGYGTAASPGGAGTPTSCSIGGVTVTATGGGGGAGTGGAGGSVAAVAADASKGFSGVGFAGGGGGGLLGATHGGQGGHGGLYGGAGGAGGASASAGGQSIGGNGLGCSRGGGGGGGQGPGTAYGGNTTNIGRGGWTLKTDNGIDYTATVPTPFYACEEKLLGPSFDTQNIPGGSNSTGRGAAASANGAGGGGGGHALYSVYVTPGTTYTNAITVGLSGSNGGGTIGIDGNARRGAVILFY